jgi:hypothetical protein
LDLGESTESKKSDGSKKAITAEGGVENTIGRIKTRSLPADARYSFPNLLVRWAKAGVIYPPSKT